MRYHCLKLLTATALAYMGAAWSQGQSRNGRTNFPVVTVCDVLRTPLQYDGRLLRIRGRLSGTDEGTWLLGEKCSGTLITEGHVWPSAIWLTAPGRQEVLHPLDFQLDEESGRSFNRSYRRLRRRVPDHCIVSTLTGLFETRSDWSQFKRFYRDGTRQFTGFGHLGEAPGQLVIKSEDDVAIDPNCSGAQKAVGH